MSKVIIKRTINFDFLGEEYKDCYIIFAAIPVSEYADFTAKVEGVDDKEAMPLLLEVLKSKFVGGKFIDENAKPFDLTVDNIGEFDGESITRMFATLTGQNLSPK